MKRGRLLFATLAMIISSVVAADAVPVRQTDTDAAEEGNILVSVPGYFEESTLDEAVGRVNQIRQEACRNGYINPSTGEKLTMADYVPIKWSGDLEWIAQTRAAEAFVYEDHTRPNGSSCFSVRYNNLGSSAEVLAWGFTTVKGAIEMWYSEKGDWVRQNHNAMTGHYTSMIDPENLYMGMACFGNRFGASCASAGEFSWRENLSEYRQNFYGDCIQMVEVNAGSITKSGIAYDTNTTTIGGTIHLDVYDLVSYDGFMNEYIPVLPTGVPAWSTSNKGVAIVSADGTVTGTGNGKATITVSFSGARKSSVQITVTKPKAGMILEKGDASYKITKAGKTVAYLGSKTATAVTIPAAIKIGKTRYEVTSIANNAFSGNRALLQVKIGSNVREIGKQAFMNCTNLSSVVIPLKVQKIGQKAFYGCGRLGKVTIKTGRLTSGNVGKAAFSKTGIKTVKVPKGKKKAYQTLLRKKGLSKRAKVK